MTDEQLRELYHRIGTIAVVGASQDPAKHAHAIPAYLHSQGFRIIPVSPRDGELYGEKVRHSAPEISEPVDLVNVFRPPAEAEAVVRDVLAMDPTPPVLWFQPGTDSPEAVRAATDAGLTVLTGVCIGVTHARLGLGPGPRR